MIEDVEITRVSFPEGEYDFVWCLLSYDEESINFESFIGVDVSIEDASSASEEFQNFDKNVFSYADDWDEFEKWVKSGGFDFTIVDYEKKRIDSSLG
jgi:CDP-glycerol glycerophosphotransferase (TagB/SpsB family)